jgi:Tfp pilus assembly PilM family ATPase
MKVPGLFQTPPPDVALAIESGRVVAARVGWNGGQPLVTAHAAEPVPAEAIVPGLGAPNLPDIGVVTAAVQRALAGLGGRSTRAALVIPDPAVKVSLLRFEKVPPRPADLEELVRWQVRKSAPFPLEQARVSFTPGLPHVDGGQEFVVTVARDDVLAQYEQACEAAGVHVVLLDVASFNVINGVLAGAAPPAGDWLLVHAAPSYATLAVVRRGHVIFYRNRADSTEGTLADLVHQTAMYYEDRLQGAGFECVLVSGASAVPGGADTLRRALQERLRLSVDAVDPCTTAAVADRISLSPELVDALAPLVGVLVREWKAA